MYTIQDNWMTVLNNASSKQKQQTKISKKTFIDHSSRQVVSLIYTTLYAIAGTF